MMQIDADPHVDRVCDYVYLSSCCMFAWGPTLFSLLEPTRSDSVDALPRVSKTIAVTWLNRSARDLWRFPVRFLARRP